MAHGHPMVSRQCHPFRGLDPRHRTGEKTIMENGGNVPKSLSLSKRDRWQSDDRGTGDGRGSGELDRLVGDGGELDWSSR